MARLLNAYARETGLGDLTVFLLPVNAPEVPASVRERVPHTHDRVARIPLPRTGKTLFAAVIYVSPLGHHRFGYPVWVATAGGDLGLLTRAEALAALLVAELLANARDAADRERARRVVDHVANSTTKTAWYAERWTRAPRPIWAARGAERFGAAEQSLLAGHPFHPAPKCSEGFTEEDLPRYAPELGASFPLHYLAVDATCVDEGFCLDADSAGESGVPRAGELFPAAVVQAARRELGRAAERYRLLPCHPWQARFLFETDDVRELARRGWLIDLGPLGDKVYPTSSVRTVWDPHHRYSFKLPLSVRITNFVRVNPPDQLRRTLDVCRLVTAARRERPPEPLTVLRDVGYRTVRPPHLPPERSEWVAAASAVIFRENPVRGIAEADERDAGNAPVVVAALLEQRPGEAAPPLWDAVRAAARASGCRPDAAFAAVWARRYAAVSLAPLLSWFAASGISLEAHVQNSLVLLRDGWPVRLYVRDLEGASVSRQRAVANGWVGTQVAADSPALYDEDEAWHRFQYYVVVNHLGHLFSVLAWLSGANEADLWTAAAEGLLRDARVAAHPEGRAWARRLLEAPHLPAKANLISYVAGRSECPAYVPVPNLFRRSIRDALAVR